MPFEINEDFAKEQNLTPEQVTAINGSAAGTSTADEIAEIKKGWDGKANTDAQNILEGAAKSLKETSGIERNSGEKITDYITRAGNESFASVKSEAEKLKAEYNEKIKNFKGDEATAKQLTDISEKFDAAQIKLADFDSITEKAGKYDILTEEHSTLKLETAFNKEKPKFPDTANSYEVEAKWSAFKKDILREHDIVTVDGVAIAIDKENEHKRTKLSDLIAKNEGLTALMAGRKQNGANAAEADKIKVDKIPFEIPADAKSNAKSRQKAIQEHLATKGLTSTSPEYPKLFKEYNDIIRQQTA